MTVDLPLSELGFMRAGQIWVNDGGYAIGSQAWRNIGTGEVSNEQIALPGQPVYHLGQAARQPPTPPCNVATGNHDDNREVIAEIMGRLIGLMTPTTQRPNHQ